MRRYRYTAVNLEKKKIKGTFIAKDETDLGEQLAKQGLFLVKAKPYSGDTPNAFFTLGTGKATIQELTNFSRQFSIMLNTNIAILDCLDILRNQPFSAYFKKVLDVVYDDVKSGILLSDAFDKHRSVFPHFFRSMVRIGETSGKLDTIFVSMADYYEKDREIKRKVKSAMSYPIMLLCMAVGIIALMFVLVIPRFKETLADMDVEITGITKVVYNIYDFLTAYYGFLIAGIIMVILVFVVIGLTEKGKYFYDVLKLKLPGLKTITANMITARFARAFGLLLSSGMDLSDALDSVEVVLGNRYLTKTFHEAAESVRHGVSLTVAFDSYKLFPQMLIQMIAIGERTATVDDVLLRSCNYFDSQVESSLNSITSKIQPIMLIIIGAVVGTLFIAVYAPLLSMMDQIGNTGY